MLPEDEINEKNKNLNVLIKDKAVTMRRGKSPLFEHIVEKINLTTFFLLLFGKGD